MKYFKNENNEIRAFEESDLEKQIVIDIIANEELISITEEEKDGIIAPNLKQVKEFFSDELYTIRNNYIAKNISFLGQEFVADEKAQSKVTSALLFAQMSGAIDDTVVAIWNTNTGDVNITLQQLKLFGSMMFAQEQRARAILTTLKSNYKDKTLEELNALDIEYDFESAWNVNEQSSSID